LDIAMRLVFYVFRKTLLVFLVIFLAGVTFFATRDVANIYIVVNEGLKNRTSAILDQNIDVDFLDRFFSNSFLNEDQPLNNNVYAEYNIYSYRQRIRARLFWVWPWNNEARISVEQIVSNIIGEPKNVNEGLKEPPEWESGRKEIIIKREMGRWQIHSIRLIEPITTSIER